MKTLRHVLACALLLAGFAACTDNFVDFATPRDGSISVVGDEVKPDATAADSDGSDVGEDGKDEKDPTAGDGEDSKPGN